MFYAPRILTQPTSLKSLVTETAEEVALPEPSEVNYFCVTPLDDFDSGKKVLPDDCLPKDHFEIIYVSEGTCTCRTDFETFEINENCIGLIRPGQARAIQPDSNVEGYIISFSKEAFYLSIEDPVLLKIDSCFAYSTGCKRSVDYLLKAELRTLIMGLAREYTNRRMFKFEIIRGLLKLLLIYISRSSAEKQEVTYAQSNHFVQQFFHLLEEKFMTHTMATDYAREMSVTTSYLNTNVKKISGYTTRYHIQQRRIMEAKRLMMVSKRNMKEIAYYLGFEDIAHFSKFFKNVTGQTFTNFKRQVLLPEV